MYLPCSARTRSQRAPGEPPGRWSDRAPEGYFDKSHFCDIVTSRAVIASAPVEEEQFAQIIEHVKEEFDLEVEASHEAFELFQSRIRVVAGRFWDELEATDRKMVVDRLTKLTGHVKSINAQLFPLGRRTA